MKKRKHVVRDRHLLYEASVQDPGADLDFFQRVYRRKRARPFRLLREDFCGTAVLACEWVKRNRANRAWGVDKHRPTLEWGRRHRVGRLGAGSGRIELIESDVREVSEPAVDVVAALNFSYCVFKQRGDLRRYFSGVRRSLRREGIFFLDAFGGMETMSEIIERRKVAASESFDGRKVPGFTYVWEQARFNAINHDILCHIHFELGNGSSIRRAFTYDWRLWTLPELQEILLEAGFAGAEVYLEGWDDDEDDSDGVFRRRRYYENQDGWIGYVVGLV